MGSAVSATVEVGVRRINDVAWSTLPCRDRTKGVDGELIEMTGYAYSEDDSAPGKLKVHLDGVPVDAPYWVLALGNEDGVRFTSVPRGPHRDFASRRRGAL